MIVVTLLITKQLDKMHKEVNIDKISFKNTYLLGDLGQGKTVFIKKMILQNILKKKYIIISGSNDFENLLNKYKGKTFTEEAFLDLSLNSSSVLFNHHINIIQDDNNDDILHLFTKLKEYIHSTNTSKDCVLVFDDIFVDSTNEFIKKQFIDLLSLAKSLGITVIYSSCNTNILTDLNGHIFDNLVVFKTNSIKHEKIQKLPLGYTVLIDLSNNQNPSAYYLDNRLQPLELEFLIR